MPSAAAHRRHSPSPLPPLLTASAGAKTSVGGATAAACAAQPGGRPVVPASPWSRCSSVHSGDSAQRSAIRCCQQAASHLAAPRVIRLLSRSALLPGQRTPQPLRRCSCGPAPEPLLLGLRQAVLPLRPRPAAAAPAVRPRSTVLSPRPGTAPGRRRSAHSLCFPCSSS